MTVAVINVCVDPRLEHEVLRIQVHGKLERLQLRADRIFITNEPGGNIGSAIRGTLDMLRQQNEEVVFAAVLHHDDCIAAGVGLRRPLEVSASALMDVMRGRWSGATVLSGNILTSNSEIRWSDDANRPRRAVLGVSMPRMYGR